MRPWLSILLLSGSCAFAQMPPHVIQDLLWQASRANGLPNVTSGLIGWWKLDEVASSSAADSSGNGNTAFAVSGPITSTNAVCNTGFFFSGNYLTNNSSSFTLTGDFTLSCWLNTSSVASFLSLITKRGANSFFSNYEFGMTSHLLRLTMGNSTNNGLINLDSALNVNDGKWYHCVAVMSGTNASLYVNVTNFTTVGIPSRTTTSNPLNIAAREPNHDINYTGALDDVRIYNRALSSNEVRTVNQWRP